MKNMKAEERDQYKEERGILLKDIREV